MITNFRNTFLSNFYESTIFANGFSYPTVEHAYQACKSLDPVDWEMFSKFKTPTLAKKQGRYIKMRKDWDDIKVEAMEKLLIIKFKDPILAEQLKDTGSKQLIEVNNWGDTFWGESPIGNGKNTLGNILMCIRDTL